MRLSEAHAPRAVSMGASAPAPWRVDQDALKRACERLALSRPVVVHVTRGRGGRSKRGLHRDANGAHVISVVNYVSAERASRTLWHELAHAQQLERLGADVFHRSYDRETLDRGYDRNAFEVEARYAERRHQTWFPLVLA